MTFELPERRHVVGALDFSLAAFVGACLFGACAYWPTVAPAMHATVATSLIGWREAITADWAIFRAIFGDQSRLFLALLILAAVAAGTLLVLAARRLGTDGTASPRHALAVAGVALAMLLAGCVQTDKKILLALYDEVETPASSWFPEAIMPPAHPDADMEEVGQ